MCKNIMYTAFVHKSKFFRAERRWPSAKLLNDIMTLYTKSWRYVEHIILCKIMTAYTNIISCTPLFVNITILFCIYN